MAYIGAAKPSVTDRVVTSRIRRDGGGLMKYAPVAAGAAALLGLIWVATRKKSSAERSAA